MKCPICTDVNLAISERQGIEIDYCPQCRGVWLDRGELDKIIERSASPASQPQYENREARQRAPASQERDDRPQEHEHRQKKKGGGFLGDLFDF